jgi:Tol biopolymer transport system component
MHRRLLTPILTLLVLLTALPGALASRAPAEVAAAEVRQLDSAEDEYVALSPDGARIAGIGAEGGLCIWQVEDMTGACAERVGRIRAESIAWSPDGTAVAFSLDHVVLLVESDIFVYDVASGELANLTDDGYEGAIVTTEPGVSVDGFPAWSPDSRELAFVRSQPSDETFGTVIMRIDRAGGEPAPMYRLPLDLPFGIFTPMHWLPDDTMVYTQASFNRSDPEDGAWQVSGDGDARLLVPGVEGSEIPGPVIIDVVPESGTALVSSWYMQDQPGLWLLDMETGAVTPVPDLPKDAGEGGRPRAAAFSPDGSALIGQYETGDGFVLAVTNLATGEATRVTGVIAADVQSPLMTWSGDRVLVSDIERAHLVSVTPTGTAAASSDASPGASPIASASGWRIGADRSLEIDARYPMLSPDGTQLAGMDDDGHLCVWVTETLVSTCVDEKLPIREATITWSPDGTAVAFALDAIRLVYESDIYVYELATGELVNLTDDGVEGDLLDSLDSDPPADDVPVWSPDSREIAFARSFMGGDADGSTTIMRIDRTGGEPVEVVPLDVEQPFALWMPMHWLPDGTLLYAQSSNQMDDARNGIWKVGMDDGSSPLQIAPGTGESDIPGAMIAGVDAERGRAIVFSLLLASQFGAGAEQPLFWLVDIASGERAPFPALPALGGDVPVVIEAAYAPDGATILLVTLTDAGVTLMTMDPETLAVAPVAGEPLDLALLPDAVVQWVDNDTVVLHASGGSMLVSLELAG